MQEKHTITNMLFVRETQSFYRIADLLFCPTFYVLSINVDNPNVFNKIDLFMQSLCRLHMFLIFSKIETMYFNSSILTK